MIQANELRTGNWVNIQSHDQYAQIIEIKSGRPDNRDFVRISSPNLDTQFAVEISQIVPIPLTEEILLKAGFEIGGYNFVEVTHPKHPRLFFVIGNNFDSIWWNYNIQGTSKECESSQIEIKYIHQLQNLFFALTGEEIKIEV